MELLAPAGDLISLKAAINNGADAIYFGAKSFNARENAANIDDIGEAVRLCHLFNVKAYLTLNTSIKQAEIPFATDLIHKAAKAGVDAFIITDLSLLPIIKNSYSDVEVHASTQMGIHNRYGALLLQEMGFDRIILSRECTFSDIIDIKKHIKIPLEIFVQGALCTGFSGSCLFSSMLTRESGNRGRCLQLCRKYFSSHDANSFSAKRTAGDIGAKRISEGYLLSSKDLCLIDELQRLKEIGVDSIKIEGRLKRPEYVAGAVSQYRAALDGKPYDKNVLKKLFNRGEYTVSAIENSIYQYAPSHIGVNVGEVVSVSEKGAVIKLFGNFNEKNGYKVLRNKIEIGGFKGIQLKKLESNQYLLAGVRFKLAIGDCIHITTDAGLNENLMSRERKLKLEFIFKVDGHSAILTTKYENISLDISEKMNPDYSPMQIHALENSLSKLGGTNFTLKYLIIESNCVTLPISAINSMRRRAIATVEEKIISAYVRKKAVPLGMLEEINLPKLTGDIAVVDSVTHAKDALSCGIKNIVFHPADLTLCASQMFVDGLKSLKIEGGINILLKLPIFCDYDALSAIERIIPLFNGLICNNYYGIYLALKYNMMCIADINIMNDAWLWQRLSGFINSSELKESEISPSGYLYTYGYLPLMYLKHCPHKLQGKTCGHCADIVYKDEKGYYYIKRQSIEGASCVNVLYNGVISDIGEYSYGKQKYFDFTIPLVVDAEQNMQQKRSGTSGSSASARDSGTKVRKSGKSTAKSSLMGSPDEDIKEIINQYKQGKRVRTGNFTNNHLSRGIK